MNGDRVIYSKCYEKLKDDVAQWSKEDVLKWLNHNGFTDLAANLANCTFSASGQWLLSLSPTQLQQSPFNMTDLHEIDHLQSCIDTLRKQQLTNYMNKGMQNGYHNPSYDNKLSNGIDNKLSMPAHQVPSHHSKSNYSSVTIPLLEEKTCSYLPSISGSLEQYPVELFKTAVGLVYMFFGFSLSVFMLQIVHERVPSMEEEPPLPDVFFDLAPKRIEGAFLICEWIGIVLVSITVFTVFLYKHRWILFRRICFIMGTLYIYRSISVYVTTLPVPGFHFKCAPKVNYKLSLMITRALAVLYGGGLTVTGSHHYCGDYLFSGHTVLLLVSYMTIVEYTPKRWIVLHWICWILTALGIVCILLAHDHYTIDVMVAYIVTTRLYWGYHTLASISGLKQVSHSNMLSRSWWFPLFRYFEQNITGDGPLPRQYNWPLPWPKKLKKLFEHRSATTKGA